MNKKQLIDLLTRFKDDGEIIIAVFEKDYATVLDQVFSICENGDAIQINARGIREQINASNDNRF